MIKPLFVKMIFITGAGNTIKIDLIAVLLTTSVTRRTPSFSFGTYILKLNIYFSDKC